MVDQLSRATHGTDFNPDNVTCGVGVRGGVGACTEGEGGNGTGCGAAGWGAGTGTGIGDLVTQAENSTAQNSRLARNHATGEDTLSQQVVMSKVWMQD